MSVYAEDAETDNGRMQSKKQRGPGCGLQCSGYRQQKLVEQQVSHDRDEEREIPKNVDVEAERTTPHRIYQEGQWGRHLIVVPEGFHADLFPELPYGSDKMRLISPVRSFQVGNQDQATLEGNQNQQDGEQVLEMITHETGSSRPEYVILVESAKAKSRKRIK